MNGGLLNGIRNALSRNAKVHTGINGKGLLLCAAAAMSYLSVSSTMASFEPYPTLVAGPQIWFAAGELNCGAPFVRDPCTTALAHYQETQSTSIATVY
jgi:hypothetical protein